MLATQNQLVPASNPRFLEKALLSHADTIVLDLEDGVAPEQKDIARQNIKTLLARLASNGYDPSENRYIEICLRINSDDIEDGSVGTTAAADLDILVCGRRMCFLRPWNRKSANVNNTKGGRWR
jgi:citrate lyase subunit beta / citryl-CoA lyase